MAKIYVDKIWIDGKTLYAMAESGDNGASSLSGSRRARKPRS